MGRTRGGGGGRASGKYLVRLWEGREGGRKILIDSNKDVPPPPSAPTDNLTDSKAYWSIMNRSCNYEKSVQDISVETFLDHVKDDQDSDFPNITPEKFTHFFILN